MGVIFKENKEHKMSNNDFDTMLQSLLHTAAKNLERSVRLLKVVGIMCEIPTTIRDEYSKQEPGVIVYDEDGEVAFVGTLGQVSVFLGLTGNKIHRLINSGEATEDGYTVDLVEEGGKK